MTGPSAVGSVIVPALSVSSLAQPPITAPMLEAVDIGAAGILGIDTLQGHSIDIDFDRSAMTVRPSRRRRVTAGASGDEIVVVARSLFGQLIVTDAHWRGRRIAVVIDTGSAMTIGNPALLALMAARARPLGAIAAISVTGMTLQAQAYVVDDLSIGGVGFSNVPVAIADATPFHRFGLEHRPALMLGMDTLRLFRRVRIDFATRDVEFTLPRDRARAAAPPRRVLARDRPGSHQRQGKDAPRSSAGSSTNTGTCSPTRSRAPSSRRSSRVISSVAAS